MVRAFVFVCCCVCSAGILGGVADASVTVPDWPADGATVLLPQTDTDGPGGSGAVYISGGAAGVAFMRGAEYPAWVPDVLRGFVPWWLGGRPVAHIAHQETGVTWVCGGPCSARPQAVVDSVDDYSEFWTDREDVSDAVADDRYEDEYGDWSAGHDSVEWPDGRGGERDRAEKRALGDEQRADERYEEER